MIVYRAGEHDIPCSLSHWFDVRHHPATALLSTQFIIITNSNQHTLMHGKHTLIALAQHAVIARPALPSDMY